MKIGWKRFWEILGMALMMVLFAACTFQYTKIVGKETHVDVQIYQTAAGVLSVSSEGWSWAVKDEIKTGSAGQETAQEELFTIPENVANGVLTALLADGFTEADLENIGLLDFLKQNGAQTEETETAVEDTPEEEETAVVDDSTDSNAIVTEGEDERGKFFKIIQYPPNPQISIDGIMRNRFRSDGRMGPDFGDSFLIVFESGVEISIADSNRAENINWTGYRPGNDQETYADVPCMEVYEAPLGYGASANLTELSTWIKLYPL